MSVANSITNIVVAMFYVSRYEAMCICIYILANQYSKLSRLSLGESLLRALDYPRPDPNGNDGAAKLYGDHYGFHKGNIAIFFIFCTTFFRNLLSLPGTLPNERMLSNRSFTVNDTVLPLV